MTDTLEQLLQLSHELGVESRELAILGEGNTSVRVNDDTFLVKASGASLPTLDETGVACCRFAPLMDILDRERVSDDDATRVLLESRVDESSKKPSVEAMFHAYLLTLPGVNFVAHVHPVSVNAILCSPLARHYADYRLFPDEIVCCGRASVLVPYVDPGVPLARAIRTGVAGYRQAWGDLPRVILLQNHGLIAAGSSAAGALAAVRMADKAARIFLGAVACAAAAGASGPTFMTPQDVARIEGRDDEAYRRRMLKL